MALFEVRAQRLLALGMLLGTASCAVYGSDLVDGAATLLSTGGAMTGGGAAGAAAGNSAGDCSDCYEPEVVAGASGMDGGGGSEGGATAGGGGATSAGSHSSGGTGGAAGASSGGAGGSGGNAGATSTPCTGKQVSGHCLYLGATGASCAQSCVRHGGVAANASSFLGTPAQGGTLQNCAEALEALGVDAVVTQARRTDGRGLGCHLYGSDPYWLTSPAFSASAQYAMTRIVCACAE